MLEALAAALLLGGLNTLADFVSSELRFQSRPTYMFARIALVCYCVGGIIGARARQLLIGSIGGLMIAALVAAAYYLLVPSTGVTTAAAAAWALFWISFTLLDALMHGGTSFVSALAQGIVAAVLSAGLYLAISTGWTPRISRDLLFLRTAAIWSGTFLPGFLVLFWRRI